jgi:hypothetical protein
LHNTFSNVMGTQEIIIFITEYVDHGVANSNYLIFFFQNLVLKLK